jgi:hypothetical protein
MADLIARLKPILRNPYLEPGPDERAFAEDLKARGVTVILKKGRLGYSSAVPLPQEVEDRLRHMHAWADVLLLRALAEAGVLRVTGPLPVLRPAGPCRRCGFNVYWKKPKGEWVCLGGHSMRGVRPKRITITVDRETMWRRWEEWRATERRRREEGARRLVEQVIEQGPIVGAENLSPEQQKRTRTAMGIIRILATLAGGEISIGQIVAALKNNDDDVIEAAVRTLEKGGLLRSLGEYYYEWTVKPPWDDP